MTAVEMGVGAGGAALLTTLTPVVGAAAGALHLLTTFIVAGVFASIMGQESVKRNITLVFGVSGLLGSLMAVALVAGVLSFANIPFTLATLGFLLLSFAVSTLVMTACCCFTNHSQSVEANK